MNTDESIFDYFAAAEETANQLDGMAKRIPGELKAALQEEWRKSPWLVELPKAMDAARAATERTESATRFLNRSLKIACLAVCLAAVVIPLATWGWAYWQTMKLREERAGLQAEMESMAATAADLRNKVGGGIELIAYKGGAFGVILPDGMKFQYEARADDKRNILVYR